MTALARWRALQLEQQGKKRVFRRPTSALDEVNWRRAERWRNQVIKEVAKMVAQIQNAGLGEFKIRDLNDDINKLLREKDAWEDRIKELGGPDYKKVGPKMLDKEGKEVPGSSGYKYFGAAKDLPGVKELFEAEEIQSKRKTRAELLKDIDVDYYGYLDDEDNLLVPREQICEAEARKRLIDEFNLKLLSGEIARLAQSEQDEDEEMDDDIEEFSEMPSIDGGRPKSKKKQIHIQVPSQQEVAQALLDRKKKELLAKYVSEDQLGQESEAKKLVGKT